MSLISTLIKPHCHISKLCEIYKQLYLFLPSKYGYFCCIDITPILSPAEIPYLPIKPNYPTDKSTIKLFLLDFYQNLMIL